MIGGLIASAVWAGIEEAKALHAYRERMYSDYLVDCRNLGAPPKPKHDFMLELQNAESLRRLSHKKFKVKTSIF